VRLEEVQEDGVIPAGDSYSQLENCESLGMLLKVLVNGDEQVERVVRAIVQHDETSPRYIAGVTGLDIKVVYNVKKKLRRRLRALRGVVVVGEIIYCTAEKIQRRVKVLHKTAIAGESRHGSLSNG
jgi:hypothetical protein